MVLSPTVDSRISGQHYLIVKKATRDTTKQQVQHLLTDNFCANELSIDHWVLLHVVGSHTPVQQAPVWQLTKGLAHFSYIKKLLGSKAPYGSHLALPVFILGHSATTYNQRYITTSPGNHYNSPCPLPCPRGTTKEISKSEWPGQRYGSSHQPYRNQYIQQHCSPYQSGLWHLPQGS